ncbi:MAG: hypothetical protein C4325_05665 [Blastocatellia bacterium]
MRISIFVLEWPSRHRFGTALLFSFFVMIWLGLLILLALSPNYSTVWISRKAGDRRVILGAFYDADRYRLP